MRIDGKTELVGIIGYPIDYTLSPAMHNAAFHSVGLNWAYLPLRVHPGELRAALKGLMSLGFMGANVTIPYKIEAVRFLDEVRGEADLLGAVNTVVREKEKLIGHNTDVEGFAAFLRESGTETRNSSALIIGAGGASRAVALALAREGASRIFIMNRTVERAQELKTLLKRATSLPEISVRMFGLEGSRIMKECDLVINSTPLAYDDIEELPFDYRDFGGGQLVVDLNYSIRETAFLKEAASRGAETVNGEGMLLYQAAASFRLWTGRTPPVEDMREALVGAVSGTES